MWQSRMSKSLVLAVGAAVLVAACGGKDSDAGDGTGEFADSPEVTINLAYPFAADHHILKNVIEPWLKGIEQDTDGTVKFAVHPGGALADPEEVFELTAGGAFEAGLALPAYTPGQFPLGEVIELPFMFESSAQATETYWDLMEQSPEVAAEYEDVVILALAGHDPGELYTSEPVRAPGDVKGMKIRTPGAMTGEVVSALGGSPVSIAATEIYDSLDRGIVDGYMTSRTGVGALGLEKITKHATLGAFYTGPVFLVMNQEAYDGLSDAQRAVIDETRGRELSMLIAADYDKQSDSALDLWADAGVETYAIEGDELEEWRAALQPVVDGWIARQEDAGLPAQQVYDLTLDLRE